MSSTLGTAAQNPTAQPPRPSRCWAKAITDTDVREWVVSMADKATQLPSLGYDGPVAIVEMTSASEVLFEVQLGYATPGDQVLLPLGVAERAVAAGVARFTRPPQQVSA